jgi:two-component system LytT family response regulator
MHPIRVLVADDEDVSRDKLATLLEEHGDMELVSECRNGIEAAAAIREMVPDLALLDVQMPGLDAFGIVDRVGLSNMPAMIFVTGGLEFHARALQLGACACLLKPYDREQFSAALSSARRALSRDVAGLDSKAQPGI